MVTRTPRFASAEGTNTGDFTGSDWAILLTVALIWGSSFLWIAIGLETLTPAAVAFLRLLLGAGALAVFAPARKRVDRRSWPAIALIGLVGNAGPSLLFGLAQQRVESSVAGMINAATPLAVLLVSIAMLRRKPARSEALGLLIGFGGVALMAAPNLVSADAQPIGIAFLVLAVFGYGLSTNLVVPLQQEYGGPAVILRALLFGSLVLAPFGLSDLASSQPSAQSLGAVFVLGVLGTGLARAMAASLAGRTGASRSALITYFIPVVAITLGVVFRDESIELVEIMGTTLVVLGAFRTSRSLK